MIKAAFKGEKNIVEPTYVYLPGIAGGDEIAKATGVDYFSVPVELGVRCSCDLNSDERTLISSLQANGAEKAVNILTGVTEQEQKLLDVAVKGLKTNIEKGVDFVKNPPLK